jgi:valyl-tRNA synthetase
MEELECNEMFTSICAKFLSGKKPKALSTVSKRAKKFMDNTQVKEANPLDKLTHDEAIKFKQDYSKSMWGTYDPTKVESHWNQWWEDNKFYHMSAEEALSVPPEQRFTMNLPPPNITGVLHVGHALTVSLEDLMCRHKRMQGYKTMFLPGADHAGIATQMVVEKKLAAEGKSKHDLGRDKFLECCWEWKEDYGARIFNQVRRLGVSFDWDRMMFTLDEQRTIAVEEAFVQLFERKLIFRANRLVNWDCTLNTAVSQLEVEDTEFTKPTRVKVPGYKEEVEFGVMIDFAYKLKDDPSREIIVSTTRIETMLGDTGVAVNPADARYADIVGKELIHPFLPNRKLKIITDEHADMSFGTGAVKVTPAHDKNDFEIGKRANLEFINILNGDGTMNEQCGKYQGMPRYDCRKQIIKDLDDLKLYKGKKANAMNIGFSSRSKDPIEPMIKPQWYVDCAAIGKELVDIVETGELELIPPRFNKTWNNFVGNLEDWCISRQLWWGHRIPVYLCRVKSDAAHNPSLNEDKDWVAARSEEEAIAKACEKYGKTADEIEVKRDEDV